MGIKGNILLMRKDSSFYRQQPPEDQPQESDPQALRRYWEALKGGWKNPHLKYEQWAQRFYGPQEWLAANPGTTMQDYRKFRAKFKRPRKPRGWLGKAREAPNYTDFR